MDQKKIGAFIARRRKEKKENIKNSRRNQRNEYRRAA